tara:strand:+ start:162 stop:713 length:552 start_codon:yes stop_codon:yes gene_type:complete
MTCRLKVLILATFLLCFYSNSFAIPNDDTVLLKAKSFEFDGENNLFSAKGNVNIIYGKLKIWAKKGYYKKNSKILEAKGRVIAKQKKMTLYCKHLKALLKKDTIEAKGRVKVLFLDYVGTADRLVYNLKEEKAFLIGDPKVVQGRDTLKAEKIIMNFKNNTIQTKGKTKIKVIPKDKEEGVSQ